MNYFTELQERIREIRLSERFFYQKIKDIYTTSIDYDPKDEKTIDFIGSFYDGFVQVEVLHKELFEFGEFFVTVWREVNQIFGVVVYFI